MTTNFDNNALTSSGGFKPSTKDTPIDIRSRVETETDILSIPNPYVGMIVYVRDTGKRFEVLSIKEMQSGLSIVSRVGEYKEFSVQQNLDEYAKKTEIPTKLSQLQNDTSYASEDYVNEAIANAQLGGDGEVDLNAYYTSEQVDAIVNDYTGGKKQVYLTQAEYDLLTDLEKNNTTKVYNITDATEQVIPTDLTIDSNNLLQLKDSNGNTIGTGVTVSTTSGGNSSSGTVGELILTSPGGHKFKLVVNDEGALSTEEMVTYGNIITSVSELSINKGQSGTFTISLSQVPTNPQAITLSSNNSDVTVNPSLINISDTNPHIITVTASESCNNDTVTVTLSSPNVSSVTVNVNITSMDSGIIANGLQYEHNEPVSTTLTEAFDTRYNLITDDNKDFTLFFKYNNVAGEVSDGAVSKPVLSCGSLDGLLLKYYTNKAEILFNRGTVDYIEPYPPNTITTICIVKEGLTVKGIKEDGTVWATVTCGYEPKALTNTLIVGGECYNNDPEILRYHEVTFYNLLIYNRALTNEEIMSNINVLNS